MPNELQPNSRSCFVCGMENPVGLRLRFFQSDAGEVAAAFTAPDHFQGYPGILHGGIAASMLDEAAARAHMGIDPPRFMFTAKLEIRYRAPVPVGAPLRIVGKAGRVRGRMAESTAAIYGPAGELLVEANALLSDAPAEMLRGADLDALGWRIYPAEGGR